MSNLLNLRRLPHRLNRRKVNRIAELLLLGSVIQDGAIFPHLSGRLDSGDDYSLLLHWNGLAARCLGGKEHTVCILLLELRELALDHWFLLLWASRFVNDWVDWLAVKLSNRLIEVLPLVSAHTFINLLAALWSGSWNATGVDNLVALSLALVPG